MDSRNLCAIFRDNTEKSDYRISLNIRGLVMIAEKGKEIAGQKKYMTVGNFDMRQIS
jgi:predicted mannosyl-3-phosphoglycerate phosphatase (HAD superfamily)